MPKVSIVCLGCGATFQEYECNARKFCGMKCRSKHGAYGSHGMSRTRLHGVWSHMKTRCNCPTVRNYEYYGGRGIRVCEEWANSFEAFMDWATKNGYTESLEIDRIDVNGNYEPGNCRWATRTQQMQNTRKRRDAKTSKYKGVSRHSQQGCWVAQICSDKRVKYIGSFTSEIEAAQAYDAAAKETFGEFASLNFCEGAQPR